MGGVSSPLVASEWEAVLAGHSEREFAVNLCAHARNPEISRNLGGNPDIS